MRASFAKSLILCFLFCMNICSADTTDGEERIGYRLVKSFWNDVKHQEIERYSDKLACNFQGLNTDGVYDKADQVEGLSGLTVTSFDLENLTTSVSGKTLVISYDFYATGEGIVSGPSIDVWYKSSKGWKQISHSYVPFN